MSDMTRRAFGSGTLPGAGIAVATTILFAISWVMFPQSVSGSALSGMLPFASILVIVALGQTLVIQQGGVDLSVPGIVSLAGVIGAYGAAGDGAMSPEHVAGVVLAASAAGVMAGLFSGLLVTRLAVAPIVSTLGVNALLYGINMALSGGTPGSTAGGVTAFANIKLLNLTILLYIAVVLTLAVAVAVKKTAAGRRFEMVGASNRVARAAGIAAGRHQLAAYMASGLLSATAGMLLAGVMQSPSAFQGDAYLMSSIAAVVLGGTSLLGGVGNFAATAIAALFLTQLQVLVLISGATIGVQYLFQGFAIIIGVSIYTINFSALCKKLVNRRDHWGIQSQAGS